MYAVKQRVNLGLNNIKFSHHGFCPKKTYSKLRLDLLVSNTGLLLKRAQNIQNLGGFLIISLFPWEKDGENVFSWLIVKKFIDISSKYIDRCSCVLNSW